MRDTSIAFSAIRPGASGYHEAVDLPRPVGSEAGGGGGDRPAPNSPRSGGEGCFRRGTPLPEPRARNLYWAPSDGSADETDRTSGDRFAHPRTTRRFAVAR